MILAIVLSLSALALAYVAFYLMGRPCLTCTRPTIDCLCPLPAEVDDADDPARDFEATRAAGYLPTITWDTRPDARREA